MKQACDEISFTETAFYLLLAIEGRNSYVLDNCRIVKDRGI